MLQGTAEPRKRRETEADDELLHDVRSVTTKARRGATSASIAEDAALVSAKHALGEAGPLSARLGASSGALRLRREAVWDGILARGVDACGVGWLLRGFYQDHARSMDAEELRELETVLQFSSEDLASFVTRAVPAPRVLAELPVYKLLAQYFRYWAGEGQERGGEYV